MKHIFIVNPVAGMQDAAQGFIPDIKKAIQATGIDAEIKITNAPKHATEIVREYGNTGEKVRFYAVGGDGTFNETLFGAYPFPQLEVASFPCGSGNDFVRSFGTPEQFMDFEDQIKGTAIPIDLIEVDGGVCAAITSTGLDAEVAYNIPKYRRIPFLGGTMAYNISILEKLLRPLGKNLQIKIDGRIMEGCYLIATVCNGQTYGGGYRAAPMASLNDGILDVILVKKVSRLRIANIIGRYKEGKHIENGEIIPEFKDFLEYYTAKEVEIIPLGTEPFILNVDGECGPAKRLMAKVLPLAGRFVLPGRLATIWQTGAQPFESAKKNE